MIFIGACPGSFVWERWLSFALSSSKGSPKGISKPRYIIQPFSQPYLSRSPISHSLKRNREVYLKENKTGRGISYTIKGCGLTDREHWPEMQDRLVEKCKTLFAAKNLKIELFRAILIAPIQNAFCCMAISGELLVPLICRKECE